MNAVLYGIFLCFCLRIIFDLLYCYNLSLDNFCECTFFIFFGERKRRGKEQTHTNTPGPEWANPERAREKKSGGRRTRNKTSGGGEDRSA